MLKIIIYLILYILYGTMLCAFLYRQNIWGFKNELKKEFNESLFCIIAVSPIVTLGLIFLEAPRQILKFLINDDDNINISYTEDPFKSKTNNSTNNNSIEAN